MNHANLDFLLDVLTLVVPLAVTLGAAMLGSHLVFTLPAWLKRRAHRRALSHAPQLSLAIVIPLRTYSLDLCESWTDMHAVQADRRTA